MLIFVHSSQTSGNRSALPIWKKVMIELSMAAHTMGGCAGAAEPGCDAWPLPTAIAAWASASRSSCNIHHETTWLRIGC